MLQKLNLVLNVGQFQANKTRIKPLLLYILILNNKSILFFVKNVTSDFKSKERRFRFFIFCKHLYWYMYMPYATNKFSLHVKSKLIKICCIVLKCA